MLASLLQPMVEFKKEKGVEESQRDKTDASLEAGSDTS